MKSKSVVIILSFLFGSTGAGRFYLGQNQSGWSLLLLWWIVLPGIIYAIIKMNLFPNWAPFIFARLALPICCNIYETLRFAIMKPEKYGSQDMSTRNTITLTILAVIIAAILNVAAMNLVGAVKDVDITKTDAEVVLSSVQLSSEFRVDEEAYRKKYDNLVLQIEGIAALPAGMDLETETTYLELTGAEGDAFGIKCFFLKENSSGVSQIEAGDHVVLKGEANGNILDNCLLISVKKK